jgi:hypothetical protein
MAMAVGHTLDCFREPQVMQKVFSQCAVLLKPVVPRALSI